MKLIIYKAIDGWRWHVWSRNWRILAVSSESYTKRSHCARMARKCCPTAKLVS